jgi:hypothetical protein
MSRAKELTKIRLNTIMDRCLRGRKERFAKSSGAKASPGFESLSVRHKLRLMESSLIGKAPDFDSGECRFESYLSIQ